MSATTIPASKTARTTIAASKAARTTRPRPGPATDIQAMLRRFTELRRLIGYHGLDYRRPGHQPTFKVWRYKNDRIRAALNGVPGNYTRAPSNKEMMEAVAGKHSILFEASGHDKVLRTLAQWDIDCKKAEGGPETLAQCRLALQVIVDNFPEFRGLFITRSTSGNCLHGTFEVRKGGEGDVALNGALSQLRLAGRWILEGLHARGLCPLVTAIELNGDATEIEWDNSGHWKDGVWVKGVCTYVKAGKLARLPVAEIIEDPDGWDARPVIGTEWMCRTQQRMRDQALRFPPAALGFIDPPAPTKPRRKHRKTQTVPVESEPRMAGSLAGHPFSDDEIQRIRGPYLEVARTLFPDGLTTSTRDRVKHADIAMGLAVHVHMMKDHTAEDQSMSTKRAGALWGLAHKAGITPRAYSHKKWAAIRRALVEWGYIDEPEGGWDYWRGEVGFDGRYQKGRCCKYYFTADLLGIMEVAIEEGEEERGGEGVGSTQAVTSPPPLDPPPGQAKKRVHLLPDYHFPVSKYSLRDSICRRMGLPTHSQDPILRGNASDYYGLTAAA